MRMRKTGASALLVVLAALALATSGFAANLLANPGFENGAPHLNDNWEAITLSGGWYAQGMADGAYNQVIAETTSRSMWTPSLPPDFHSGSEALRFSGWKVPVSNERVYQLIATFPGQSFSASAWAKPTKYGFQGFGDRAGDYAELWIEELDATGALVTEHKVPIANPKNRVWTQLSKSFTASANTYFVRFSLHATVDIEYNLGSVVWDDCVLDSTLSNTVTISGTVTSGGAAVAGATVSAGGTSTTTNASGFYSLSFASGVRSAQVSVTKAGYYDRVRTVYFTLSGSDWVVEPGTGDFAIDAVGTNLLANAGFDNGATSGWSVDSHPLSPITVGVESLIAQYGTSTFVAGGDQAAFISASTYSRGWTGSVGEGRLYQWVPVKPNSSYTASCRFRGGWRDGAETNWGTDGQFAALFVQEFNSSGALVNERLVKAAEPFDSFQTLSTTLATGSATAWVRVGAYARVNNWFGRSLDRAVFDSFEFRGDSGSGTTPPTLAGLYGVVRDKTTGNPISGATIQVQGTDYTATSSANGVWNLTVPDGSYQVRASKDGYHAQVFRRTAPAYGAYYDLVPVGNNLLQNPGFDDGWPGGWGWTDRSYVVMPDHNDHWVYQSKLYDSGEQSVVLMTHMSPGYPVNLSVWQHVPVQPNAPYVARCKFHAGFGNEPAYNVSTGLLTPTNWKDPESPQWARMVVEELDVSGNVLWYYEVPATKIWEWETLEVSFTTDPDTAIVRVSGVADMLDEWWLCWGKAVFDSFELNGPPGPAAETVGSARTKQLGDPVVMIGKPVVANFPNVGFYLEEPDRSSGILVTGYSPADTWATVFGTVGERRGERCIIPNSPYSIFYGGTQEMGRPLPGILPVGISQGAIDSGLGAGGLLTQSWGRVTSVGTDDTGDFFAMNDGSGDAIRVYNYDWNYTAVVNDFVAVRGCAGRDLSDPSDPESAQIRVIRAVQVRKVF